MVIAAPGLSQRHSLEKVDRWVGPRLFSKRTVFFGESAQSETGRVGNKRLVYCIPVDCDSNFRADAQRVIRRREAAKADKTEDFIFLLPTRHAMRFLQRGARGW